MFRPFRFAHLGVAGALAVAGITSVGLVREAGAAGPATASVFVPITPCRLADTRTGTDHVGTRTAPIGQTESVLFAVWGTNGNCTVPNTSTGIVANVTAVNPTSASYVTVYPADATRPTASNLNVTAASPPTPNQVTVGLSAAGAISAYNNAGTLDLIIDVVGYYQPAGVGGIGPQGPAGTFVSGTEFFSGYDTVFWATNTGTYVDEQNCVSFAAAFQSGEFPLDLPIGAQITTLQVRYVDKGAGGLIMTLHRGEPGISDTGVQDLVSIGTDAADFHRSDQYIVAGLAPVSAQNSYYIKLFSQAGTGAAPANVEFCGALVTYTVPTLAS